MEGVFSKKTAVHFYDCDLYGRMKLTAINQTLADIADEDYAQKGMSHSWLWEHGFVFLLSKVSIRFQRFPTPREVLTVSTWEREVKGASFFRSFSIHDEQENLVLTADSAWMLVDPKNRQILRPSAFPYAHPTYLPADCPPCRKIKWEDGTLAGRRKVVYSDLDGNGHVYNAVYAGIACDFLPQETLKREISAYQVNFAHEAKLGDTLDIWLRQNEQSSVIKGTVGDHDSFLCVLEYRPDRETIGPER